MVKTLASETHRWANPAGMPDIVYHTSSLRNRMSIASVGLIAADPCDGRYGMQLLDQPVGVYTSAEPDDLGVWSGREAAWGIWSITGATSLPHRQDPLNPEHFVIECDVPHRMVAFHSIGSRTSIALPRTGKKAA